MANEPHRSRSQQRERRDSEKENCPRRTGRTAPNRTPPPTDGQRQSIRPGPQPSSLSLGQQSPLLRLHCTRAGLITHRRPVDCGVQSRGGMGEMQRPDPHTCIGRTALAYARTVLAHSPAYLLQASTYISSLAIRPRLLRTYIPPPPTTTTPPSLLPEGLRRSRSWQQQQQQQAHRHASHRPRPLRFTASARTRTCRTPPPSNKPAVARLSEPSDVVLVRPARTRIAKSKQNKTKQKKKREKERKRCTGRGKEKKNNNNNRGTVHWLRGQEKRKWKKIKSRVTSLLPPPPKPLDPLP